MTVPTIIPGELAAEQTRGSLLLDVRSAAEFRGGHLRAAINLPLELVTVAKVVELRGPDADRRIILLCAAGKRAMIAAERLSGHDLKPIVVAGGTVACQQAGLPMDQTAGGMISVERQVRIAAGAMVFTGVLLGAFVHPGFYSLSGFVGAGLVFAGVTDWCGMGLLLARAPWNR